MPTRKRLATAASSSTRPPAPGRTKPRHDLDVFANPNRERDYHIRMSVPEFTCLCPLTGQPDFAHFVIDVIPDRLCVELKSLKLYMWSFRDRGAFHEAVTNEVLDEIVRAIKPRFARVSADWFVRGGITTSVTVEHRQRGWKPPVPVALDGLPASHPR